MISKCKKIKISGKKIDYVWTSEHEREIKQKYVFFQNFTKSRV